MNTLTTRIAFGLTAALVLAGCSEAPDGIAKAQSASTTVAMDFFHRPLPEIPLPNDIATRYDPLSATGRRLNASMIAPTELESRVRELLDQLDGWGVYQPITIPFTGPLDVDSILAGHRDVDYDMSNDVIYLIDVTPGSPTYGEAQLLDVGEGNFPVVLERPEQYLENDPRGDTLTLFFEEHDEDLNGNGVLDRGEDTDADGTLDAPNYLPGHSPAMDDLIGRADAIMYFYERESNTLIVRPLLPLRERTTYAVVVTRRLLDESGQPVGSPFPTIHHTAQTEALRPLPDVLPAGLALDDVAFAWTFTTQTIQSDFVAVRDGLYGHGIQSHLSEQFPAEVAEILPLRDEGAANFPDMTNPFILYTEQWTPALGLVAQQLLGMDSTSKEYAAFMGSQAYIDFHIIGAYWSPQLFDRVDEDGMPIPYNDQSWPVDLDRVPVEARGELVYFWLTVPREEVCPRRANGEAPPVVILGHGYGSDRFEAVNFNGYFAKHGLATLSIDNVSHGIDDLNDEEAELADTLLSTFGLGAFGEAVINRNRAIDHTNDGRRDGGADFWTAYLFHTRDVVRQTLLDYHQLVRVVRSFDGERRWAYDLNGDGENELAGDFDGDGVLEMGLDSPLYATGGSLGGIMSSLIASTEPNVEVAAPISAGGGLGDVGLRSQTGGVPEAVVLRVMTPLYLGSPTEDGDTRVQTVVISGNRDERRDVGSLPALQPWDTVILENLDNGERGCAYVSETGTFRLAVESDRGDRHRLTVYSGESLVLGDEHCTLEGTPTPTATLDTFEVEVEFESEIFDPGTELRALAEGLGLRRANPEMRRFLGIGQLVLDGADPTVWARHMEAEPLFYPGTGEQTGAHVMIVNTLGDMSVPVSTGTSIARAAGFIELHENDDRWGIPANQQLIETRVLEAVHNIPRYTMIDNPDVPVHLDVENFSQDTDLWAGQVPRLEQPLHLWSDTSPDGRDRGGISGVIFPYPKPDGQHGFAFPGGQTESAIRACRDACPEGETCDCTNLEVFDVGWFMFNAMGRYMASGGTDWSIDLCNSRNDCEGPGFADPPAARPFNEIP